MSKKNRLLAAVVVGKCGRKGGRIYLKFAKGMKPKFNGCLGFIKVLGGGTQLKEITRKEGGGNSRKQGHFLLRQM